MNFFRYGQVYTVAGYNLAQIQVQLMKAMTLDWKLKLNLHEPQIAFVYPGCNHPSA